MHPVLLSGSPILDVDATMLLYMGLFFVLFLVLRRMVFRPLMELFDAREKAIDGAAAEARALERDAERKLADFEGEMRKVKIEAGAERDRLRAEGGRLEKALLERVQRETEETVREARATMQEEAEAIRAGVRSSTPLLARQIAEKLLDREVAS